jgi:hypothetical protein
MIQKYSERLQICADTHIPASRCYFKEKNMGNSIELLSPAGSYESFRAALGAGADAVYAGGGLFGA